MKNEIECPVDNVSINENKARLTAFFVLIFAAVFLMTGLWVIMAFLVADFSLRASNLGKYSALAILSDAVIKQLHIKNKPADRAPKRFAAAVGLLFTLTILVLALLQFSEATIIITSVLLLFAFLESFAGFCAGCYVYTFLKRISVIK